MSSEQAIEQTIQDKELTAPRITPQHINSCIESKEFVRVAGTVTVCALTLKNKFRVVGCAACVSPENFDEEIGRTIAYQNAYEKIWELEGYLLAQRLSDSRANSTLKTTE